ncbi:MAG: epoxyqueuosine reductase [Flavobacteriales bacterium]|jgi:epoxyqueuosine reductase
MINAIAIQKRTQQIKDQCIDLGFSFVGISKAGFLEEEEPRLSSWLKNDYQGEMSYMNNHFDMRLDPRLIHPGTKSVISLLLNYYPSEVQKDPSAPKLSKYAYGKDYHFVIKDKLKQLLSWMDTNIGEVNGRAFVDSAPVMDKVWAKKAGLGWIGKHSNLINKEQGSYFFVAELMVDLDLEYDGPIKDYCGTCTKCIDACPTDAIVSPYEVDGSKCISYATIELKKNILPSSFEGKMDNWVFGCDICQDVCPWNRFSKPHEEPLFAPHEKLLGMSKNDWHEITEELFGELFRKSAVKRTKLEGLKRNLKFLKSDH